MSASGIDNRIVQMQFDNRQFERGIKTSEKSLDRFKKALDFNKCESSLNQFHKLTENLSFDHMADNLQKLTDKFTGLGTMGERVLSQVRQSLDQAAAGAKRFFDSMTVDQINAGFEKFGLLNKNVQTIMSATGRAEEDVYAVLKRLNQYTDQTSYNFTDMAANIGKFTSVGIGLEEAEKQMEGIANWAARSGGGIQEASRAMYNLSQAMGVGALTKIDWKSIENAGMATKEFKQQLIQAGLAAGTLIKKDGKIFTDKKFGKQTEVTYMNLAETLSKKWADTEVMQKAFMGYYYEDLYYEGKIASEIESTAEQRQQLRDALADHDKLTMEDWKKLDMDTDEVRQKMIDAAVDQKKLLKEVNEEGYTVYKTIAKNGKQIEITKDNFEKFVQAGLLDESLLTVTFNLDGDALIETTEEQNKVIQKALGDDSVILKKDWNEDMAAAGLATEEVAKAAIEAGVSLGNLKKTVTKDGKVIYTTAKKYGKEMEVTTENFAETLKLKWFDEDVANKVSKFKDLGKSAYESAQKCTTFTDVLGAWKDQISTGWMQSFNHIFGELSESMELFSNICNKVGTALDNLIQLRNGILQTWGEAGGRDNLWAAIVGEVTDEGEVIAYEGAYGFLDVIMDIGRLISNGFWEMMKMFAPSDVLMMWDNEDARKGWLASILDRTVGQIKDFIGSIKTFFEASADGSQKSRWQQIQDVVNAVFATFVLAYSVIRDIGSFLTTLFDQDHLGPSVDAIMGLMSELGLTISQSAQDAQKGSGLKVLLDELLVTFDPMIQAINTLITTFTTLASTFLKSGRENESFKNFWFQIAGFINQVAGIIEHVGTPIITFFAEFIGIMGELFQNGISAETLQEAGSKIKTAFAAMLDSIFDFIPNFSSRVKGVFDTIYNWIAGGFKAEDWEKVKGKFASIGSVIFSLMPESIQNAWTKVSTTVSETWGKVKSLFTAIYNWIANGFQESDLQVLQEKFGAIGDKIIGVLPEGIRDSWNKASAKVKRVWNSIKGLFTAIYNWFANGFKESDLKIIQDKFGKIGEKILGLLPDSFKTAWASVSTRIKGIWEKITGYFQSLFGEGTAVGSFIAKLKNANVFQKIIDWFTTTFGNLKGKFQGALGNTEGDAASFGTSLKGILEKVQGWFKNVNLSNVLLAVVGALGVAGLIALIAKIVKIGKTLSTISDAIRNGIDIKKLFKNPFKKDDNDDGGKGADSFANKMLKLAAAFAIVTACVAVIANLKAEDAWRALAIVSLIAVLMTAMTMAIGAISKKLKVRKSVSAFITMYAIALAMGMVIKALMPLSNVSMSQLGVMVWGMIFVMLGLLAMSAAMKQFKLSFKNMSGILGLCAGIWLIVSALIKLKDVEVDQLIKMGASLIALLAILGAFAFAMQKIGGFKGTGLANTAFLAIAVGLLVFSLIPLAMMPFDRLLQALIALGIILGELSAFIFLVDGLSLKGTGMAQLLAVAASIILLTLAMIPLALLPRDKLIQAVAAVLVLMTAIGVFVLVISKYGGVGLKCTGMLQLIPVAAAILLIALAMIPLANMPQDKLIQATAAVLAVMTGLGIFIIAVNKFAGGGLKGAGMASLIAVALSILILVSTMMPLANMDWESLKKMGAGLLATLAAFLVVVYATKQVSPAAAGSAGAMLGALSGFVTAFANALKMVPVDMKWETILAFAAGASMTVVVLALVIKKMKKISIKNVAIISIAMTALSGMMVGFAQALAMIPSDMNWGTVLAFAAGLTIMLVGMAAALKIAQNLSLKGAIVGIIALAAGIVVIMGALSLMMPILLGSVVGSLEKMSAKLTLMARMLSDFVQVTNGFSEGDIDAASKKFEALYRLITGLKDVGSYKNAAHDFSEICLLLGSGLNQFQFSTSSVANPEGSNGIKLLEKLLGLKDQLLAFTGMQSIAVEIAYLGAGLQVFNEEVSGITETEPPALALLDKILGYSGKLEGFTGGFGFANSLSSLGAGLDVFSIESSAVTSSDLESLNLLDRILGYSGKFEGFTVPGTFSSELSRLGAGLSLFSILSVGISTDDPVSLKLLDKVLGYSGKFENFSIPGDFASTITRLGSGLKVFDILSGGVTTEEPTAFGLLDKVLGYSGNLNLDIPNDFSSRLSWLGAGLSVFNTETSGITTANPPALELLTNMANNADSLKTLTGIDLTGFSDQMAGLGGGLSIYALGVKEAAGIDIGDMPDVSGAIAILTSLTAGLTDATTGDFTIPEIPMEEDELTHFGVQLAALAGGLIEFAKAAEGLGDNTQNALDVLDFVSDIKGKLTEQTVDAVKFFGDNSLYKTMLTDFGLDLAALGGSMADYSEKTKGFVKNQGALDVLDFVAEVKGKLTDQTIKAVKFFGDNSVYQTALTDFGLDLVALGASMADYSESTKSFSKNQGALNVLDFVTEIKDKLTDQTIKAVKFFGDNSLYKTTLTDFGLDLVALGGSLSDYNEKTKGFVKNQGALDVLDFLTDIRKKLTNQKIKVAKIFTDSSVDEGTLTAFGTDLAALGSSLASYSKKTADFQKNDNALLVLDFMAELKGKLNSEDIALAKTFDDADIHEATLTAFGNDIAALGSSMASYSKSVSDFKQNEDALKAIDFFYDLQTKLLAHKIDSAIFSWLSSTGATPETLSGFGTDIAALGSALAGFAESVNFTEKGASRKLDFTEAMKALDALHEMAVSLPKYGGLVQLIEGSTYTLSSLADDITLMGGALAGISDALSTAGELSGQSYDIDLVNGALAAVRTLSEIAMIMASGDLDLIASGVSGNIDTAQYGAYYYGKQLAGIVKGLVDTSDAYNPEELNKYGSFVDNLVDFMKRLDTAAKAVGGFEDTTIFESFKNVAIGIQKMAETNPATDFVLIGKNISAGVAQGIRDGQSDVVNAAVDMAVAAYNAAKTALDEHSPSKLFMEMGQYVSEGLAIGIKKDSGKAEDASENMAYDVIGAADGVMANISSLLASDVDAEPTIRPVLDLTNVEAGAQEMGRMLGETYSAGLDTSGASRTASRASMQTLRDNAQDAMLNVTGLALRGAFERIDQLTSSVLEMGERISNLKLVMDSGALVGAVSGGVDAELGRNEFYANRRN